MESRINKLIRELLEKFGIKSNRVIGEWNLGGHLKNLVEQEISNAEKEMVGRIKDCRNEIGDPFSNHIINRLLNSLKGKHEN